MRNKESLEDWLDKSFTAQTTERFSLFIEREKVLLNIHHSRFTSLPVVVNCMPPIDDTESLRIYWVNCCACMKMRMFLDACPC